MKIRLYCDEDSERHAYRLRGRNGQEVRFQLSAVSGRATGQRLQVTAVRSPVSAFLASGL